MKQYAIAFAAAGLLASASAIAQEHDHSAHDKPETAAKTEAAAKPHGMTMQHGEAAGMRGKGMKMSAEQMQAHHLQMLQSIIDGAWRSEANKARDAYRHPLGTLAFFGVSPHSKVVEVWPGAGWYAEILVPYATHHGSYTAAVNDPAKMASERSREYYAKQNQALREKFAADAETYGKAQVLEFDPAAPVLGKPGSADVVLTFRNVHNWRMSNQAEGMFKAFFAVLKKGGTLGVVEHRADKDVPADDKSGYVSEAQVIALAKQAGFVFAGRSEINANGNDSKDYPDGVWTLPPTYRLGDTDRAKYAAIGESDRMTLRFVKP